MNYHCAKLFIKCWNGNFFGLASLPFDKCDKSCKILQHSAKFEANRNVWLFCCRFC